MEDIREFVSNRISNLRVTKGVSALKLSTQLGYSKNYITEIETKKVLPSLDGLNNICDYFGITMSEFFDIENVTPDIASKIQEEVKTMDSETINVFLALAKAYNSNKDKS